MKNQAKKIMSTSSHSEEKKGLVPTRFNLNVGGTKYEVSDLLLDQFPYSMLRKITPDTWNIAYDSDDQAQEIFIDRNGVRFQFILDYMREDKVALPLLVPWAQLVLDMEYFGIFSNNWQTTLCVADPKDVFNQLGKYN